MEGQTFDQDGRKQLDDHKSTSCLPLKRGHSTEVLEFICRHTTKQPIFIGRSCSAICESGRRPCHSSHSSLSETIKSDEEVQSITTFLLKQRLNAIQCMSTNHNYDAFGPADGDLLPPQV